MRTRTLLLPAVAVTILPIWLWSAAGAERTPAPARLVSVPVPVTDDRQSPEARALGVLRRWDARRAAAWSTGDPAALARLYVPGSRTGAEDVTDLRRWVRRGLRVTGLHQQVASLVLARRSAHRVVALVTDRTVDGVAVGARRRTAVPVSAWATHRVVLLQVDDSWRVAEAVDQPAR
jgi:hypothetical protein